MEFRTALCQLRLLCLHAREPRFSVRLDSFHKHIYFGGKVDIVSGFTFCSSCSLSIARCWRSRSRSWDVFCQGFFTCVASFILCRTAVSNPFEEKRLWDVSVAHRVVSGAGSANFQQTAVAEKALVLMLRFEPGENNGRLRGKGSEMVMVEETGSGESGADHDDQNQKKLDQRANKEKNPGCRPLLDWNRGS